MKHMLNRLVCRIRGHKWEFDTHEFGGYFTIGSEDMQMTGSKIILIYKCTRCGQTKKEQI